MQRPGKAHHHPVGSDASRLAETSGIEIEQEPRWFGKAVVALSPRPAQFLGAEIVANQADRPGG